jgi:hypothetical protein
MQKSLDLVNLLFDRHNSTYSITRNVINHGEVYYSQYFTLYNSQLYGDWVMSTYNQITEHILGVHHTPKGNSYISNDQIMIIVFKPQLFARHHCNIIQLLLGSQPSNKRFWRFGLN